MGPESLKAIGHAMREATRLGIEAGITNASSWNSGGAWVGPEHASKGLYWSRVSVAGPARFSELLPLAELPKEAPRAADGSPAWHANVAVLAIPTTGHGTVLDLSDRIDGEGRLTWDAPPGQWSVLRFICANTGEQLKAPSPNSRGLIIDHFSAEAARMHTEYMLGRLRSEIGDFRKSALKYFYACSYEVRGSIWTPGLPEEFRRRRGYDMKRFLPVLAGAVVENEEVSERFVVDYRRTVADLFVENFYRATRTIVNREGLKLVAEAGGPGWPVHQVPVDALKALGALDIPRGEFWKEHKIWVVKETASAAHIYGQRLVQMEAFTSWRHWQDGPRDLKEIADRAFCDGANHFVWHTMPHVPPQAGKPGWAYHAGTHLGPNDPWWPMAKPFLDYLARCSHLLRQGLFVADVCYYYGERGFNFAPEKQAGPSLGFGYDYDAVNSDVILTRMAVKDGRIVLPDGMSYELLVLPEHPDMDLEVLERLEQLVRQGATVVGPKPRRATSLRDYPACDEKVRKLADQLWGPCDGRQVRENTYGRGKVYWGVPLREILQRRGVGPDFAVAGAADLDFIHRRDSACDIYFVRNKKEEWAQAECTFRVKGRAPEIWDPVTGETRDPPANRTRVHLTLPPFGSTFVVFRAGRRARREPTARVPEPIVVPGPWEVSFPPGWGAPASRVFSKLISWTEDTEPGVRYFSGNATYRSQFDLPAALLAPGLRLWLDLGDVRVIARARLNGKPLGIAWTPPFRLDITAAVRAGTNALEVEVANTWSNRLTGDALSTGEKYTRTNIPWSKTTPLLPSGLLGPVRVVAGREEAPKR
ncbi:MAG: glycosyl hydrolase [Acidobacteriota bacterium]